MTRDVHVPLQIKIQQLFADALAPMLTRLKNMQEDSAASELVSALEEHEKKLEVIRQEMETINEVHLSLSFRDTPCGCEDNILHATRSAGITFAQSFIFLMEALQELL